jgi:chemotaxis protein MotA
MDVGTIIGLILGFGVITYSILMGGSLMIFVDIPSVFIVIGGMLCAVMIHFSLPQFFGVFSIVKKTFLTKVPSPSELIQQMVNFATISRREGALALEEQLRKMENPFLIKSLQMLVDGREEGHIREMLELEIQYLQERHGQGKKILEFMSSSAPAMGMIGTLIGLVQMLRNMSSPDSIGAGMAVALITTFYGAILSNLMFTPLAGKLGIYSKAETLAMEMTVAGICSISRGENPTMVREKMQTFISAGRRQEVKATV